MSYSVSGAQGGAGWVVQTEVGKHGKQVARLFYMHPKSEKGVAPAPRESIVKMGGKQVDNERFLKAVASALNLDSSKTAEHLKGVSVTVMAKLGGPEQAVHRDFEVVPKVTSKVSDMVQSKFGDTRARPLPTPGHRGSKERAAIPTEWRETVGPDTVAPAAPRRGNKGTVRESDKETYRWSTEPPSEEAPEPSKELRHGKVVKQLQDKSREQRSPRSDETKSE